MVNQLRRDEKRRQVREKEREEEEAREAAQTTVFSRRKKNDDEEDDGKVTAANKAEMKRLRRVESLGGPDKEKISILVPRSEPPAVSQLTEELLEESTQIDMSIYTQKWPVFVDLSHPLWKLNTLQNIDLINPTAVKELDLSNNVLNIIETAPLDVFVKLKRLVMRNNFVREFNVEGNAKLVLLDLHHNRLGNIPVLSHMNTLQYLDLSNNKISSGWENVVSLRKLKYLFLQENAIDWDQDDFNDSILKLRELKALREMDLSFNPFNTGLNPVRQYKEWIMSNAVKLERLDGSPVDKLAPKERLKDSPFDFDLDDLTTDEDAEDGMKHHEKDSDDDKAAEKVNTVDGEVIEVCTHKLNAMTRVLRDAIDRPSTTLAALNEVESRILQHLNVPSTHRMLFDNIQEGDEKRRVLGLIEAFIVKDENADKTKTDSRPPHEIIEDYLMTVDVLISRMPIIAKKTMTLIALLLGVDECGINKRCEQTILDFLQGGDTYGELVVQVIIRCILPRLLDTKDTQLEERLLLLSSLNKMARSPYVIEAMRSMSNLWIPPCRILDANKYLIAP